MKRILALTLVLAAAATLSTCYWIGNVGGFTIDVSQIRPRAPGDVVRVYLLADGKLFSTGGGVPFTAEVTLGSATIAETRISIQGLPVGPHYQALVGIGPLSDGFFRPASYSVSPLFRVSPGTDTTVALPLPTGVDSFSGIAFCKELVGRSLKGVVGAGWDFAFAAEESRLHSVSYDTAYNTLSVTSSYDLAADADAEGVSSFRVNGLSDDSINLASDALINSPNGILPFDNSEGFNFVPGFSASLEGDKNILESASFTPVSGLYDYLFFRRADGLGGYSTFNYGWVNVDVPDVLDLAVSENLPYFVTRSGAFALSLSFFQAATPTIDSYKMPLPTTAPPGILSLDYDPTMNYLFMGTTDGAWYATLDDVSVYVDLYSPIQITETAGQKISWVAVSPSNPQTHQAFLSDYWLYVRKSGIVHQIPFFAILPGKPTGMAWDDDSVLYISGSEGLSAIWVGNS